MPLIQMTDNQNLAQKPRIQSLNNGDEARANEQPPMQIGLDYLRSLEQQVKDSKKK